MLTDTLQLERVCAWFAKLKKKKKKSNTHDTKQLGKETVFPLSILIQVSYQEGSLVMLFHVYTCKKK